MRNPYKILKGIAKKYRINPEQLVHALMATVYFSCCKECASALRSEDFMKNFDEMTAEIKLCTELSRRHVA
jgi:hypothetical protein